MKAIENNFESILPNWPDREKFLKQKQEFVENNKNTLLEQFDKEDFSQEIVSDLVEICLRAVFVKLVMVERTKIDEKIDINITWEKELSENFKAGIVPNFFVKGNAILDYKELYEAAQKEVEDIELRGADIFVNLREIIESLKQIKRYCDLYLKLNFEDIEDANILKEEMFEELAIKTELAMVHELGHALFFHSVFSHKNKFLKWLKEYQGYDARQLKKSDLIPIYSEEEMQTMQENYDNKRIEKAGVVLPSLFKNKYYPDSKVTI